MSSDTRRLSPQPWPWRGARRVLVEHPDREAGIALASALRGAGYAVAVCPGPESPNPCPLAGDEGCAAVHDADAVFFSLGLGSPAAREVLRALTTSLEEAPILVAATRDEADEWRELVRGCTVVSPPVPPDQLVRLVDAALAGGEGV